ncbi:hypothetical protein Y032_0370g92 [Ancylostoma ceylanicum]|uniref:Uncharacterized protein n=1 Tax=Ancylostoma ceylanicum TaxID=53326 RepID=A0A016RV60_9BILA|nr:hypothetical protein Y032_0370g92 [Ancylostoma ceylanicum]
MLRVVWLNVSCCIRNTVQCRVWNAHHPQEFVTIRVYTLSGKLVRAVDAWGTAPSFLVFRRVSRCFITAYEFIAPENLEIQRNLQHKNFGRSSFLVFFSHLSCAHSLFYHAHFSSESRISAGAAFNDSPRWTFAPTVPRALHIKVL